MAECSDSFVKNPGKDFSRNRKLNFETMIELLLVMEGGSLKKELFHFFHFSSATPSASAFCQQRNKILPEALETLFYNFNRNLNHHKTYRGYRLLACDGSDLNIFRHPMDTENYFNTRKDSKGFCQLHLNAMYDLLDKTYLDAVIQPGRKNDECRAMVDLLQRCDTPEKTIFMADRGYESYNLFTHIQDSGKYYLFRVKDKNSNGIVSHCCQSKEECFDEQASRILTRSHSNYVMAHPEQYRYIDKHCVLDCLPYRSKATYQFSFRMIRFRLADGSYECIMTNLPEDEFTAEEIRKLYNMRWGIETSFRELKYAVGLGVLHAKKAAYVMQEIYARLILYNFCEIITASVVIRQKETKYRYQCNYTLAIHICRNFLKHKTNLSPPDVENLIEKNMLPIRPGKWAPRKVRPQAFVSFLYR